jgi:hypothetical protein
MGQIGSYFILLTLICLMQTLIPHRKTQKLLDAIKEDGVEINAEKTKHKPMPCNQNTE